MKKIIVMSLLLAISKCNVKYKIFHLVMDGIGQLGQIDIMFGLVRLCSIFITHNTPKLGLIYYQLLKIHTKYIRVHKHGERTHD